MDQIQTNSYIEGRLTFFGIIIGTNGTGKTTLLKEIILNELKKKNSHILILTPDDTEFLNVPEVHANFPERIQRYTGIRKIITTRRNAETVLECVRVNFRKGLLIFDDCRSYFKDSTLDILEEIFIRRRMMMVDIYAIAHGPSKIPPAFFGYMSHLILFKTTEPITIRKDRIENIDQWIEIQNRVNEMAVSNPHYKEIHKV